MGLQEDCAALGKRRKGAQTKDGSSEDEVSEPVRGTGAISQMELSFLNPVCPKLIFLAALS